MVGSCSQVDIDRGRLRAGGVSKRKTKEISLPPKNILIILISCEANADPEKKPPP